MGDGLACYLTQEAVLIVLGVHSNKIRCTRNSKVLLNSMFGSEQGSKPKSQFVPVQIVQTNSSKTWIPNANTWVHQSNLDRIVLELTCWKVHAWVQKTFTHFIHMGQRFVDLLQLKVGVLSRWHVDIYIWLCEYHIDKYNIALASCFRFYLR